MTVPAVAGVDYSTRALDVAIVRGREVAYVKSWDLGGELRAQVAVMARALNELRDLDCALVVMEKPWLREGRGIGTAMELHKTPIRFEALAALAGIDTLWCAINAWHATVLGNGGIKSAAGKQKSIEYVRIMFGMRAASHNQSDAVCLSVYGNAIGRRDRMAVAG